MGSTPDRYRIQLDFTQDAFQELEKLKADVGASSRAETVRYAMRVLRWAINTLQGGGQIFVSRTHGVYSGVEFPFLPHDSLAAAEAEEPVHGRAREAQASGWVHRGAESLLKQQKEQFRAAYEAGRQAYTDAVGDESKKDEF